MYNRDVRDARTERMKGGMMSSGIARYEGFGGLVIEGTPSEVKRAVGIAARGYMGWDEFEWDYRVALVANELDEIQYFPRKGA